MQPPADLVMRARAGDVAALEPLFRAVQDDVYRLLLAELRHEADAEDASQETFRQAVESIRSLRDPGAFPAWLVRIALSKAQAVRRRGAAERRAVEVRAERSGSEETMARVEREELAAQVRVAVEELDPELRTAVRLRYEHGMSYEEIAEATEAPGGTVAWRLSEAHRRLQKRLAAAGAVVALAMLERELEAAPRAAASERLSKAVRSIAGGAAGSGKGRWISSKRVSIVAATALVTVAVVWMMRRDLPGGGGTPAAAPEVARVVSDRDVTGSAVGGTSKETGTASATSQGASVLTGRVFDRDSGVAVAGASVMLFPAAAGPAEPVVRTASGADGTFALAAPPGTWRIEARASGFVDHFVEREAALATYAMASLEYELTHDEIDARFGTRVVLAAGGREARDLPMVRGAEVSGLVLDAAGAPLAEAKISALDHRLRGPFGSNRLWPREPGDTKATVTTDSQGRFHYVELYPAGILSLRASREGFADAKASVEVGPGMHEVTLTLLPKALVVLVDLSVLVRGSDGRPLAGAVVFAGGAPNESNDRSMQALPNPANPGDPFTARLPADTPWIAAWAPGRGIAIASSADFAGGALELQLPVADHVVRGCVLDAAGQPVAGASVQVFNLVVPAGDTDISLAFSAGGMAGFDGAEIGAFMPHTCSASSTRTASDGTFTLEGVYLAEGGRVELIAAARGFTLGYATVKGPEWVEIRVKESK